MATNVFFLPAVILSLCLAIAGTALADEDIEDTRRYDDGPLTAGDFRGKVPERTSAAAKTVTQFAFDFKYRYKTAGRITTATLESITIYAYIRRDHSWNRNPQDERLLDHEQGHADIAQIHCMQARLAFRKKLGKGPNLVATASSLGEAAAALGREVRKEMAVFEQATRDADAEYDRETVNGLGGKQAEWRRVQAATLKQLDAQWNLRKIPITVSSDD